MTDANGPDLTRAHPQLVWRVGHDADFAEH